MPCLARPSGPNGIWRLLLIGLSRPQALLDDSSPASTCRFADFHDLDRRLHGAEVFSDLSLNPELFAAGQASQLSAARMSRQTGFSRKPWIFASKLRHDAFFMDGSERSVFSRVVKTALDRPDDSGATADIRASDRAKLT